MASNLAQIRKQPKVIGPYQIGDVLGCGACGKVFKGLNIKNGQSVAIKQVSLNHIKEDRKGSIKTEINLLKKLEHPKIVKYIDSIYTEDHLNIVLEYVENGSLDSLIKKFGKIPETLVVIYIQQVLQGLEFLHSENVIHRDIKGGNILTTKDGEVKLADFGVAMILNQEQNSTLQNKNVSFAGTPYWMAPEVINEKAEVTSACDIWSLGCTVIELLTGKPPYFDLNPFTAMIKIVYEKSPPVPEGISPDMADFLGECFEKDPIKRISAKNLLKHRLLNQFDKNALQKIMESGGKLALPAELTNTIKAHLDQVEGGKMLSARQQRNLEIQIQQNTANSAISSKVSSAKNVRHSKENSKQSIEAQYQANEERKKNSKDFKMTKSPIQGTLKASQLQQQQQTTGQQFQQVQQQQQPDNSFHQQPQPQQQIPSHQYPNQPQPSLQQSKHSGANHSKFSYVPHLTEQPSLDQGNDPNQISVSGQQQYHSSHQRKVRRTYNNQSQMDNFDNRNWVGIQGPPSAERVRAHHKSSVQERRLQREDSGGGMMPGQVFATEGDQWQNPMHYDSFGNPQQQFVGDIGQFDQAIYEDQRQIMHPQYQGYAMAPNHQHPFQHGQPAARLRGSIHYDRNVSNGQGLVHHKAARGARTAIGTHAQVTHVAQISGSNDSQNNSSTLSPFPIEELDENINNQNEMLDYQENLIGVASDFEQQQQSLEYDHEQAAGDGGGLFAGEFEEPERDFQMKTNQQFTYEQQQYWQNQRQNNNSYLIEYNQQLIRQNTSPDTNLFQQTPLQRDSYQNRQQFHKTNAHRLRTHVGEIEAGMSSTHITPSAMSRKAHIQSNQNMGSGTNPRTIQTAKVNKPTKIKKKAQYQQRFMSTTVAEEIGALSSSVGFQQSFHPSQQAQSQLPQHQFQQQQAFFPHQTDPNKQDFDFNQAAPPEGTRPKRVKKQNQSQMLVHQKQPQLQYSDPGSSSQNFQYPMSDRSKKGDNEHRQMIQQIKDLFDNQIKVLQPQVVRGYQAQKQKRSQKSNNVLEEYNQVSMMITEKMRALLLYIKSYGETHNEVPNQKEKEYERYHRGSTDKFSNELTDNVSKKDDVSYEVSPSKNHASTRSNLSVTQLKKQVMELLSPLRLVDMLSFSHSALGPSPNYQIQFAAMQLLNQICDDVPQNYKLICLSGLLSPLKEFSKESYTPDKQQPLAGHEITPKEIKVEVAYFILKAYVTSNEAVMMIFASEGYKILGQFLQTSEYEENKLLIFMAIDVFLLHFSQLIQSVLLPQAELSLIFIRESVSDKLAKIIPKLIESVQKSQVETEEQLIAQKYIDKTFDLLQHLQNGNDEVKMQFCSKELISDCLVKHCRYQMRQPSQISVQFLWRFMKLMQCLVQTNTNCERLFDRLYALNVLPCLVEILKFFFDDIQTIQMTLIYDNLKLLSLLCSFSPPRTQQASQFGLLQTLKLLIEHILNLSDKFSQNKRVKLFRQILTLLQDNIQNGSEFTKVEMLNQNLHLLMLQIIQNFTSSIKGYSQRINVKQESNKDKVKLQSKIEKGHEVNAKILEVLQMWLQQRTFIDQQKLETSLGHNDFISVLIDLDQQYSYDTLNQALELSKVLASFCFQKSRVFEKLVQVLQQKIEDATQSAKKLAFTQQNRQRVLMHHNHAKSSPNFIHNDQSRGEIAQPAFDKKSHQNLDPGADEEEEGNLKDILANVEALLRIVSSLLHQGLPAYFSLKTDLQKLPVERMHNEESKQGEVQAALKSINSMDDEHLETDIIDDDDDLESNNLKINQINILTSQASAAQPRAPMQLPLAKPAATNLSKQTKSKEETITDHKDRIQALKQSIKYIEHQYIGQEWLISNIDRRLSSLNQLMPDQTEPMRQANRLKEVYQEMKARLQNDQNQLNKLQGQSIYENIQVTKGDNYNNKQ